MMVKSDNLGSSITQEDFSALEANLTSQFTKLKGELGSQMTQEDFSALEANLTSKFLKLKSEIFKQIYTTLIAEIGEDVVVLSSEANSTDSAQSQEANMTSQFNGLKKQLIKQINATLISLQATLPDASAFQKQQTFNLYQ